MLVSLERCITNDLAYQGCQTVVIKSVKWLTYGHLSNGATAISKMRPSITAVSITVKMLVHCGKCFMLSIIVLGLVSPVGYYDECRYAEFHYAECYYGEYQYAKCL